jgi:hypothetical protein
MGLPPVAYHLCQYSSVANEGLESYCWVAATTNDILAGKEPVPPTEAADMLEKSKVQDSSTSILRTVVSHTDLFGSLLNILQELTVRLRTIASEILEDVRERILRHRDLQQVVEQRDDRIIGTRLAAEIHGLFVVLAFVDDAVREHRLIGDAEDEGAVLRLVLER